MAVSPGLVIHDVGESPVTVYRIVRSENVEDPVFVNSLRSHYEMKAEPRHVEKRAASLHMGLSVFLTLERAIETARKWPAIGSFVARLDLSAGHGFNFADTGAPGHLTLWADPVKLARIAGDITSVEV
jgi:hypothetical protein